ncbi:MAG: phage regulatory protein rha family [Lachnospiraceae bacterium]|nr:phage regulatory protein rha family [Lachnospiraceae bacterium]
MNNLVSLSGNDVFTDSKVIADGTGNKHHAIQVLITKYENDFSTFGQVSFEMRAVKYERGTNQEKIYLLNEEQATLLMTYLRNTEKVRKFKIELVRQFYEMRRFILERQSSEWIATRYQGKLTRKAETDTIQKLVDYAKCQGSEHADMLYITYSKLANSITGIKKRDDATISQLNNLELVENIILHVIDAGIMADRHYKEIYKDCKSRLDTFKDIAYIGQAG